MYTLYYLLVYFDNIGPSYFKSLAYFYVYVYVVFFFFNIYT